MQTTHQFFHGRGVDPTFARPAHHAAASIVTTLQEEYVQRTSKAVNHLADPTWGLALSALDRLTEYAMGAVCASVGSSVAGEIVARTVVEASMNLRFILQENRPERFYSYFRAYIKTEGDQNRNWKASVATLPSSERLHHESRIEQKDKALSIYRNLIDQAFGELGVNITNPLVWADAFSRFRSVGEEIHYRTVYVALCSQTHNDAEDLLNKFAIHSIPDRSLHQILANETESFSWFLTAVAVDDFSHAVACFLVMYDLIDPAARIKEVCGEADRLVADALSQRPARPTTGC